LPHLELLLTHKPSRKARVNNATIEITEASTADKLGLVTKPDGKTSEFWPADLYSLFAYSAEDLKKLLKDYQIPVDGERKTNINRFMGHIGIRKQQFLAHI